MNQSGFLRFACHFFAFCLAGYIEEIAQMAGIEKNFVDFKLNILTAKRYQLPAVPELKSNFLKNSMKGCSKCYD